MSNSAEWLKTRLSGYRRGARLKIEVSSESGGFTSRGCLLGYDYLQIVCTRKQFKNYRKAVRGAYRLLDKAAEENALHNIREDIRFHRWALHNAIAQSHATGSYTEDYELRHIRPLCAPDKLDVKHFGVGLKLPKLRYSHAK